MAENRPPVVRTELVPSAAPGQDGTPDQAAATPPANLMAAMLADPVHAPERLALEAVRLTGPQAARWVAKTRQERPHATIAELSMEVRDKYIRLSQATGAAGGALGLPGAMADVGVLAWNQARMIIMLAALHDLDPTDEERAAEILYFTDVHKAIRYAEQALDVVSKRRLPEGGSAVGSKSKAAVALTFSLGKMLGKSTLKKLATRAIPFGAIPIGAWYNGRAMATLADRAVTEYARRLGVIVDHRHPHTHPAQIPPVGQRRLRTKAGTLPPRPVRTQLESGARQDDTQT